MFDIKHINITCGTVISAVTFKQEVVLYISPPQKQKICELISQDNLKSPRKNVKNKKKRGK